LEAAEAAARSESLSACRERLESAVNRLEPDSLSALSQTKQHVGALNAWLVECAAEELATLKASEENLAFLDKAARRAVTAPRFTIRDASYIRDSLVSSRLAQSIVERAGKEALISDAVQALAVFHWVGSNVSLQRSDEAKVIRSYLDVLLTGRGGIESRIWLFGVLMRQLQRDVVLLQPSDTSTVRESLVAVCTRDGLLLFDPRSWLPVPADSDTGLVVTQPAGTEYLAGRPGWESPFAMIIAETSAVCPRMLVLQEQLPVEMSAVLYEELAGGTSAIRPLVDRVSSTTELLEEARIRWWSWPSKQVATSAGADEQQQRQYTEMMKSFEAPFERKPLELGTDFQDLLSRTDISQEQRDAVWAARWQQEYEKMEELQAAGDSEKLFGRPSSRLLRTRFKQISGSNDRSVIQQLQKIRNACIDDALRIRVPPAVDPSGFRSIPIPDAIRNVNQSATGSALYWTAICQMDRGRPGNAITTMQGYRRQYPYGAWFYPSMQIQAEAELAQGRVEAAIDTFTQADADDNPDQAYVAGMLARLKASVAPADAETDPDTPEGATQSPPTDASADFETTGPSADDESDEEPKPEPAEEHGSTVESEAEDAQDEPGQ